MILFHSVAERILTSMIEGKPTIQSKLVRQVKSTSFTVQRIIEELLLMGLVEFAETKNKRDKPIRITDKGIEVAEILLKIDALIKEPVFTFEGLNNY